MVALGVLLHAIGGFAAGSFYIPVQEGAQLAWKATGLLWRLLVDYHAPGWWLTSPSPTCCRSWARHRPQSVRSYVFGVLWGIGGLTFGLSSAILVCPGLCHRIGLLRRFRYAGAAALCRDIRGVVVTNLRSDHPGRRSGLSERYRHLRPGRHRQGAGTVLPIRSAPASRSSASSRDCWSPSSPVS